MTDRAGEQLVADYLDRLEAALADAPPDRRRELLDEIAAHVADARTALPDGGDEVAVRELLDRIGEPGEIAAAALTEDGGLTGNPADPLARPGWREGLAVPLLLFGGVLVPFFGWFPGVALLWWSKVWSTRDKALGTVALPFGLMPALAMNFAGGETCSAWSDGSGRVFEECTGGGGSHVLALILFALLLLIPLATAVHLLLRLRTRRPAEPAGGVARSAPV